MWREGNEAGEKQTWVLSAMFNFLYYEKPEAKLENVNIC